MLARLLRGEPGPLERAFSRVLFGVLTQASKIDGRSSLRRVEQFWSAMKLVEAGGKPLTTDEVVQASWPGEVLVGSSGPDRFYVAISSLRKLDLRHSLVREQGGYALRARARFVGPRVSP